MEQYTTTAGEVVEYRTPPPDVAAYLAQVFEAARDPEISTGALTELIYSPNNPVMDSQLVPGRGTVTQAVIDDPVYRVMADQLDVKRMQLGEMDPETTAERFTVTVADAASRLGISERAVRKAINERRLAGMKRGGSWRLSESSLASYTVSRRGPRPAGETVRCVIGSAPDWSASVLHDGRLIRGEKVENRLSGEIVGARWLLFRVVSPGDDGRRRGRAVLCEVDPGAERAGWSEGPFSIEGRFKVVERFDHDREVRGAWAVAKAVLG